MMRLVQQESVTLMEDHGFETTTVEEVAEISGVSASTIYRHFGTKEKLILWDEQDAVIDAELAKRLPREPVLGAFRNAVVAGLVQRDDQELFRRRLHLIYSTPAIWAAAADQDRTSRDEFAAAIAATRGRKQADMEDKMLAAVCMTALDVALEEWQAHEKVRTLDDLIDQALATAISLK